ncbi:hypothetical protein F4811DRAFT_572616 [Daldinia bambusicola]|nr:hypothetical protein F4811DRAFT_572616 [Daldinia bambusicola]
MDFHLEMAPSKRKTWVDVYDPDTGHYKPELVIKGQSSGQSSGPSSGETSGSKSPDKTQTETIDYSVKLPQGNEREATESSGANNSTSDELAVKGGTHRPNNLTSGKVKPQPVDAIEPSPRTFKGLSQSRWAPRDVKEAKSAEQLNASVSTDEVQIKPNTVPKKSNDLNKPIDPHAVKEASKMVATTPVDVEEGLQPAKPTKVSTNTEENTAPKLQQVQLRSKAILSHVPGPAKKYVENWVQPTPEIIVDLHPEGVANPEQCDVDTKSGRLMAPVVPISEMAQAVGESSGETLCNAEPHTESEISVNLDKKREYKIEEDAPRELLGVPLVYHEKKSNPREIRVPCHLRPARQGDMMQVAALYNEEMNASYKTIDKRQVALDKWVHIYNGCYTEKMPFFVAVEGWYNKSAENNGPVIAFAVMDVAVRGVFGSYKTHAAPCGKLTVIVHPDYRRRNICSALLDAVFSCCSTYYESREGYEFVNEDKDCRYMTPGRNPRKWNFIDIEAVIPSGHSKRAVEHNERFKWMASYLSQYFDMTVVYHDEKLYCDDRYIDLWLDRITFRHQCRPLGS